MRDALFLGAMQNILTGVEHDEELLDALHFRQNFCTARNARLH